MTLTKQIHAIDKFWQWFQANQTRLELLGETSDPRWDVTLGKLKAIANDLWFELSCLGVKPREFIITAAGHLALFPLVDRVIQRAPRIDGWRFIALKPALGFDFEIAHDGVELDPHALWFLPLRNSTDTKALDLRIAVPNFKPKDQKAIRNAVLSILDTALGERAAATEIQHVEVRNLPKSPQVAGYIALPELAAYLEWHRRKS